MTNYTIISNLMNSSILNLNYTKIAETVWGWTGNIASNILNLISGSIWNFTGSRNLTYYQNFTVPQQDLTNYTKINEGVWNATVRNLTYYPPMNVTTQVVNVTNITINLTTQNITVQNYTINIENVTVNATTQIVNVTTQIVDVQNVTLNLTVQNVSVNSSEIAENVWNYSNKTIDFAKTGTTENVTLVQNIANMGHVYVGNTEYTQGTAGKVSIRLVRGTGALAEIETNAECYITITYPNASVFVNMSTMTELGDGVYYYNFIVPTFIGIYPYYTNCNISDRKYFSLDTFHVYENNYSEIPIVVWNYSNGRNLTYYETGNVSINPQNIWEYEPRNLTYYPPVNVNISGNVSITLNNTEIAEAVWNYNGTIGNNVLTQITNSMSCLLNKILNPRGWGVDLTPC
jgi:hypothetical protein